MRGLIYREYKMQAKNFWLTFFGCLLVLAISMLICLSAKYGNIAKLIASDESTSSDVTDSFYLITAYVFSIIPIILMKVVTYISSDAACGFSKFTFTTAVPAWKLSLAFYVTVIVRYLLAFGLMVLNSYTSCRLLGRTYTRLEFGVIASIAVVSIVVEQISLQFQRFAKTPAAETRIATFIEIIPLVAFTGYMMLYLRVYLRDKALLYNIQKEQNPLLTVGKSLLNGFLDKFLPIAPILLIAVLVGGYFCTTKLLDRRGIRCEK